MDKLRLYTYLPILLYLLLLCQTFGKPRRIREIGNVKRKTSKSQGVLRLEIPITINEWQVPWYIIVIYKLLLEKRLFNNRIN